MPILSDSKGLFKAPRFVGERRSGRIRIAKRLHCEWVLNDRGNDCIWYPALPEKLNNAMWKRYVAGRDAFMAELSLELGSSLLIDLDGTITVFRDGAVVRPVGDRSQ